MKKFSDEGGPNRRVEGVGAGGEGLTEWGGGGGGGVQTFNILNSKRSCSHINHVIKIENEYLCIFLHFHKY